MTWGYIGAAAVTVVGGALLSGGGDSSSIDAHNREVARRNKRIAEANMENTARTGFRVGILNMQQGLLKQQFAQGRTENIKNAQQVLGATSANAAASGTIGASVQAVEADIGQKLGEAQAESELQWDVQIQNFNTELRGIIDQGSEAIQGADGQVQTVSGSSSDAWKNALLQGALQVGGMYLQNRFSLGLGQQQQAATAYGTKVGTQQTRMLAAQDSWF